MSDLRKLKEQITPRTRMDKLQEFIDNSREGCSGYESIWCGYDKLIDMINAAIDQVEDVRNFSVPVEETKKMRLTKNK